MPKKINIMPLGKRILAKPDVVEEKTAGGLVLPPNANDEQRPATGTVVALGQAKSFDVAIGDRIYFKKYSPEEVEIEGVKYLILDTEDVLAVIK